MMTASCASAAEGSSASIVAKSSAGIREEKKCLVIICKNMR